MKLIPMILLNMLLMMEKKVVVPVTFPKTKELKPSHIKDFNELELGYYNILTPKEAFIRFIDQKR